MLPRKAAPKRRCRGANKFHYIPSSVTQETDIFHWNYVYIWISIVMEKLWKSAVSFSVRICATPKNERLYFPEENSWKLYGLYRLCSLSWPSHCSMQIELPFESVLNLPPVSVSQRISSRYKNWFVMPSSMLRLD